MTGPEIAVSAAGFAAIAAIAIFIVLWLVPARKKRLMRCPETGAITLVETGAARGEGAAREVTVCWCDLWPARKNCVRACLVRYPETTPGYRVNIKALRRFDRP